MKGFKRFKALILIQLLAIVILGTVIYVQSQTATNFTISAGVYPRGGSYTVWRDGSTYYAKNNYGFIAYSGTNASSILETVCELGGEVYVQKGTYDLSTYGLEITLDEAVDDNLPLVLCGEGEDTIFQYTGSGYAISIETDWATYENVRFEHFKIRGTNSDSNHTITSGRNGLQILEVGRLCMVEDVIIKMCDVGFTVEGTSEVIFSNCKAVECNVGFYTWAGSGTDTNEITFTNCYAITTQTYGYNISGGNCMRWYGGGIQSLGTGIRLYGTWTANIDGVYFHDPGAAFDCFINITGLSASFPCRAVNVKNCYFKGGAGALCDWGIKVYHCRKLTVDTPRVREFDLAFIYLGEDTLQELLIVNPDLADSYLLDSTALTQAVSRLSGTVIENRRLGIIAYSGDNMAIEGTVVRFGATGVVYNTTAVNQTVLSVVMYGQLSSKPVVICVAGVTPVYSTVAISIGDTLVTSATGGQAEVDNTEENPKEIIGYAVSSSGGAGLVYCKIGG